MTALVVATMQTEHYTFSSCGMTVAEAREYLFQSWLVHIAEAFKDEWRPEGLILTIEQLESNYDINYVSVSPGKGYRDGQEIWDLDDVKPRTVRDPKTRCWWFGDPEEHKFEPGYGGPYKTQTAALLGSYAFEREE